MSKQQAGSYVMGASQSVLATCARKVDEGHEALAHNNPALALECAEEALELAIKNDWAKSQTAAEAHNLAGIAQRRLGNGPEAIHHQRTSLALRKGLHDHIGTVRALTNLAIALTAEGFHDEALAKYSEAIELAQTTLDEDLDSPQVASLLEGEAQAHLHSAHLHTALGSPSAAAYHHTRYVALCEEGGDEAGVVRGLAALAAVWREDGRLCEAVDALQRAITLAEKAEDSLCLGRLQSQLGVTHMALSAHESAYRALSMALAVAVESGDRASEAWACNNLGILAHRQGDLRRAEVLHERQARLASELEDPVLEAWAKGNLGEVYESLGMRSRAIECFEGQLKIGEETRNRGLIVSALSDLGLTHLADGHFLQAIEDWTAALDAAAREGRESRDLTNWLAVACVLANTPYEALAPLDVSRDNHVTASLYSSLSGPLPSSQSSSLAAQPCVPTLSTSSLPLSSYSSSALIHLAERLATTLVFYAVAARDVVYVWVIGGLPDDHGNRVAFVRVTVAHALSEAATARGSTLCPPSTSLLTLLLSAWYGGEPVSKDGTVSEDHGGGKRAEGERGGCESKSRATLVGLWTRLSEETDPLSGARHKGPRHESALDTAECVGVIPAMTAMYDVLVRPVSHLLPPCEGGRGHVTVVPCEVLRELAFPALFDASSHLHWIQCRPLACALSLQSLSLQAATLSPSLALPSFSPSQAAQTLSSSSSSSSSPLTPNLSVAGSSLCTTAVKTSSDSGGSLVPPHHPPRSPMSSAAVRERRGRASSVTSSHNEPVLPAVPGLLLLSEERRQSCPPSGAASSIVSSSTSPPSSATATILTTAATTITPLSSSGLAEASPSMLSNTLLACTAPDAPFAAALWTSLASAVESATLLDASSYSGGRRLVAALASHSHAVVHVVGNSTTALDDLYRVGLDVVELRGAVMATRLFVLSGGQRQRPQNCTVSDYASAVVSGGCPLLLTALSDGLTDGREEGLSLSSHMPLESKILVEFHTRLRSTERRPSVALFEAVSELTRASSALPFPSSGEHLPPWATMTVWGPGSLSVLP